MRELTSNKMVYQVYARTWNKKIELSMYRFSDNGKIWIDKEVMDKVDWTQQINRVTTLPDKAKLIFHESSKFPRHKLELSTYKRKIKKELADYMVGNAVEIDFKRQTAKYPRAFISDNSIYLTYDNTITSQHIIDNCPGAKITKVKEDYEMVGITKEQYLYYEYMQGLHTLPIISDEDLNKLIDGNNERIDEDSLDTLIDLMESGNAENIILGTKLFTQFNLTATPCLTEMFLMMYNTHMTRTKVTTSIVYKNMINTFPPRYKSKYNVESILEKGFVDDEEKSLVKKLVLKFIEPDVKQAVIDANKYIERLKIKFEYSIVDE